MKAETPEKPEERVHGSSKEPKFLCTAVSGGDDSAACHLPGKVETMSPTAPTAHGTVPERTTPSMNKHLASHHMSLTLPWWRRVFDQVVPIGGCFTIKSLIRHFPLALDLPSDLYATNLLS